MTMLVTSRFVPHYTIEDYLQWRGDWELWDGIAIAMTPSPFGRHQSVLAALLTAVRMAMSQQGCSGTALAELDWIVSDDTVVRPDMIIICGPAPEKHLQSAPALVAEVLSPSTRNNDITYKRQLYANHGVSTYLILDPDTKTIERLSLSTHGDYEAIDASKRLELSVCDDCELEIDSASLFA